MMSPEALQRLLDGIENETDPDEKRKRAEEAVFLIGRHIRWKLRLAAADFAAKQEARLYQQALDEIRGEL